MVDTPGGMWYSSFISKRAAAFINQTTQEEPTMPEKKIIPETGALNDDQLDNVTGGYSEGLIRPQETRTGYRCSRCQAIFDNEEEYFKHTEACLG